MIRVRVKIFTTFGTPASSIEIFKRVLQYWPDPSYGRDIVFTEEDDYTHAVLLNCPMPQLSIPKENVLGLAAEPPQFLGLTKGFVNYAKDHIGHYYIGETLLCDGSSLPPPFTRYHGFMWHQPIPRELPIKTKLMSIVFSNKCDIRVPGYWLRHSLVRAILGTNLPIDIYGRGCAYYPSDVRLKGEFINSEPYADYNFTIVIENFQTHSYFSEKLLDALAYEATPLYFGATALSTYLPDCAIKLSGNVKEDMALITAVCQSPDHYRRPFNRLDLAKHINLITHMKSLWFKV